VKAIFAVVSGVLLMQTSIFILYNFFRSGKDRQLQKRKKLLL